MLPVVLLHELTRMDALIIPTDRRPKVIVNLFVFMVLKFSVYPNIKASSYCWYDAWARIFIRSSGEIGLVSHVVYPPLDGKVVNLIGSTEV